MPPLQAIRAHLTLNLALSEPFAGNDFIPPRYQGVQDGLARALDEAKHRSLRQNPTGVMALDYPEGPCRACGVRPAVHETEKTWRCHLCHDEHRVGGWLPHTQAMTWHPARPHGARWTVTLLGGMHLVLHEAQAEELQDALSGFRLYGGEHTPAGPLALRFLANYVPVMKEREVGNPLYHDLSDEAREVEPGDLKTFEHLERDALELDPQGAPLGRPLLAVLKADVDRLGLLFGYGLREPATDRDRATISRFAALSRMLDLFFTGYLQDRIRRHHPDTYTVYAGGDDLLLIGPWRQMLGLTVDLNARFRRYTGENPNITLSAGLELVKADQPLNRSVWSAEERLEAAKAAGRNRVSVIDPEPCAWEVLPQRLADAETLNDWLRERVIPTAMVYRLLDFGDLRQRAERHLDLTCADWRARWGYQLARNVRDNKGMSDARKKELIHDLNRLMGLSESIQVQRDWSSPHTAASIALYRNRS